MYLLSLRNRIGHIYSVRIVRQTCDFGVEVGVEKTAIQVRRHDVTAVVSQRFRGKRLARPEPQASFRRKGRDGNMHIPLDRQVIHQCLRAFGDLKSDVNLRLAIDNVGIDFHVLVSLILVERGNARHTLTEQLVAELPSGEEESVILHRDLPAQHILVEVLVAPEIDGLHSVTGSTLDVVDQFDIRTFVLEIRVHFHIEVAPALKKIDQIPPSLFHQVSIDCALRKYGNQFLHLPIAKKRKRRKLRARDTYLDDRARPDINNKIDAIAVFVIVRVIQTNLAGEVILFCEIPLHALDARIDSFWGIRLARFERLTRNGCSECTRRTQ